MSPQRKNYESPMPTTDESWWESVLAEEGRHASPTPVRPGKREGSIDEPSKPPTNWEQIKELYSRDQIVCLRVTAFNRGGLLVEGDDLSGFVPFSHLVELAGKTDVADRESCLAEYVGRSINLKVIECVPEDGRIVFSERAALAESGKRAALFESLKPGARVTGQVTNVTDFGVFIDLGGVEGLIHISELSWGRVVHPSQITQVGQTLEVQVLDLAPERCRVALSLKRLSPNPWENAETDFPVGAVIPATITTITSYGAFARLQAGVEGLIHASEIDMQPGVHLKDILSEGQSVQVRVLHVEADHQRMGLSLRLD
jgi:small subunit ribosomal protein S1